MCNVGEVAVRLGCVLLEDHWLERFSLYLCNGRSDVIYKLPGYLTVYFLGGSELLLKSP